MKKRAYPDVKKLEALKSAALIDMLSDSTSKYTRLLISAPHSDEFAETRDHLLRIQRELTRRSSGADGPPGDGPVRA